jgi:hypothetical protein
MSAKVIKLPERAYPPDRAKCFEIIDGVKDDAGRLHEIAKLALSGVDIQRECDKPSPQAINNGWFIAAMALLTLLGVPRNDLDRVATEPPPTG